MLDPVTLAMTERRRIGPRSSKIGDKTPRLKRRLISRQMPFGEMSTTLLGHGTESTNDGRNSSKYLKWHRFRGKTKRRRASVALAQWSAGIANALSSRCCDVRALCKAFAQAVRVGWIALFVFKRGGVSSAES
jgi:hypothetical protein